MHARSGAARAAAAPEASGPELPVAHPVDVDRLIDDHDTWLRRYVVALRPADELDDVMQTIWLKVVDGASQLRDPEAVVPWLKSIARNTVSTMSRRHRRLPVPTPTVAHQAGEVQGPEEMQAEKAEQDRAVRALGSIPESQQVLIRRRHVLEESPAEIAAATGRTAGSVSVALARSRRSLRAAFESAPVFVGVLALRLRQRMPAQAEATAASAHHLMFAAIALTVAIAPTPDGSPATRVVPTTQPTQVEARHDVGTTQSVEAREDRWVSPVDGPVARGVGDPPSRASSHGPDASSRQQVLVGLPTGGGVTKQDEPDPDPDVTVGHPAVGTVDLYVQRYVDEVSDAADDAGPVQSSNASQPELLAREYG